MYAAYEQVESSELAAPSAWWKSWRFALVAVILTVAAIAYVAWFRELDDRQQRALAWVTLVAAVTNVACATVGCFLLLRRMSLMGDALAHSVLPGLVVAFIFAGSLNIGFMFVGALAAGLATAFLADTLNRRGGVPADASLGVVFVSLFALGVVLIKRYTGGAIHLDFDCVFAGELDLVGISSNKNMSVGPFELPRTLVSVGPVLILNIAVITLLWKEFKVSSFDPALATAMGFRAGRLHYLLMALVALTTVASFEAVGSILVVAMLIVPAATAHLLTDRLSKMLWVSAGVGLLTAVAGCALARLIEVNTAGTIAVTGGALYGVAVLLSPRYGVVSTLLRNARISARIVREDMLAMLYRLEELATDRQLGERQVVQAVGGGLLANWGLWSLLRRGDVQRTDRGLSLTASGKQQASQLVRSHRLWEAYLVEHLGLPLDHVHEPAERIEHFIDERLREQIVADLPAADVDPHGRGIPDAPGESRS
ncbi:MAG: iron ABC transporter [Planctomycetota bacterium]|nr:MAG: iron ABC transporter [Planctomycetota bacterium]REJ96030.1 MAG: iron ABC transporter [Planctomycetota bacterium]REK25476.1 MAG: iron ABC transporter [Planctomycetota bacterium]REK40486.1 MAG: iron ABC transporter [Planctomycetota bacterium]